MNFSSLFVRDWTEPAQSARGAHGLKLPAFVAPALAAGLAATAMAIMRGFTVDDALIIARYAHHIAAGNGPRFNVGGPITDGVTPIAFPWMLASLARGSTEQAFVAAKWLGAGVWILCVALLAPAIVGHDLRRLSLRWLGLMLVTLPVCVGAWPVSGLETPVAMALAGIAVLIRGNSPRRQLGCLAAGLCAIFRPEMLVWSLAVAVGHACCRSDIGDGCTTPVGRNRLAFGRLVGSIAFAAGPFAVVCAVRLVRFGNIAPLAVRAKPSDLTHGLAYVFAGVLLTGPMLAVFAPIGWRHLSAWSRMILVATLLHLAALVAVGGDWMPLSRLLVPALAPLAIVFAELCDVTPWWSTSLRFALSAAAIVWVAVTVGTSAARVGQSRSQLITQLRGQLQPSDIVATVDIGWVGTAHEGTIVDLAGVTDPEVAALPGGHTTKSIPSALLRDRGVTCLVLQVPAGIDLADAWDEGRFSRGVESQIARMPWIRSQFRIVGSVRSSGPGDVRYALLRRVPR